MIVMDPDSYMENRRRGKRRGKGKKARRGSKRHHSSIARMVTLSSRGRGISIARRNGEDIEYIPVDDGDDFVSNRRRGRGKSRRSGKGRRSYGKGRRSYGKSRRAYGKARRWSKSRKHSRRGSKKRGGTFKGIHRVKARRSGKSGMTVFLKNTTVSPIPNLFGAATTDAQRAYLARARAARGGAYAGKSGTVSRRMSAIGRERARMAMLHRAQMRGMGMGGRWGMGGAVALPPWFQAAAQRRAAKKAQREARKAQRMALAVPAIYRGLGPRDLRAAMRDLTHKQVEAMFPDYATFRDWMRSMRTDRTFRRWSGKASRFGRRGRWASKRRFSGRKGRWSRRRGLRRGRGRRRFGRGKGRWSRRRRGSRRYGRGRGRRRGMRRGRWSRRFHRNGFTPNMPFTSFGEMAIAGLVGLGTFGAVHYASKFASGMHPLAGALAGLVLGGAAAFFADKMPFIGSNDAYAKGMAVAGILSVGLTAVKALLGATGATSGFGSYYQAQAGFGSPFQQAMAGNFQQAQAGFGEYYGANGLGEYVSNDGAVHAVNDFGEYVAGHLNVEGYGDYEVSSQYAPGADGFGYMNDGVRPDGNLDHDFDVMEAAAGFSGAPSNRSDYVPTIQSANVGSRESSEYSGVFDVGGSNGVFG